MLVRAARTRRRNPGYVISDTVDDEAVVAGVPPASEYNDDGPSGRA
ncbi:hypothetical protein ACFYUD_11695 [Nocardia tengchongensis]